MHKITTTLLEGLRRLRRAIPFRTLTECRDRGVGHADFMSETFNE